jgi:sphingosine-1-phosphate phosphatase 1
MVRRGRSTVILIQRLNNPLMDTMHSAISETCGIYCYLTLLPLMAWVGEARLFRQLTLLMAMCVYVGNALKDLVCAPRPDWAVPPPPPAAAAAAAAAAPDPSTSSGVVRHVGHYEGEQEYGLPSTHTINTLCMVVYLIHHIGEGQPAALCGRSRRLLLLLLCCC